MLWTVFVVPEADNQLQYSIFIPTNQPSIDRATFTHGTPLQCSLHRLRVLKK